MTAYYKEWSLIMDIELNMNSTKYRSCYFDNLKFLLITLVVIGHTIEPLIGLYSNAKLIYNFIYSFHMPLFVFISGYFSKNINSDKKNFLKINSIFIAYIIFQLLYSLFNIYILKIESFKITFIYPYWIMWYLLSLFTWNLILPYFSKVRYPIIIAIAVSILCGYDSNIGYYLSLSRTIIFFPYFLVGYFCQRCHIDIIKKYIRKKYAILGLFIIFLLMYLLNDIIDYRWFYGSFTYEQLNSLIYPKYVVRILTYILATAISVFVLILIPNKNLFFTKFGSRTVAVYVFHGFIIKILVKYNFFDYINSFISEVFIIILSLLIVIVLSSKFINKITKIILHPEIFKQINLNKI
ncbi:acyltransferase family protein [Clostridium sp. LBM24168]